ncbi:hypothetical protein GY45DRAFT_623725 [Cubamyces sp. BRFM 1775]|nr:hypothetical protein GY45DRAFT_623725 [Cubamyces sp. BRFM 1775]
MFAGQGPPTHRIVTDAKMGGSDALLLLRAPQPLRRILLGLPKPHLTANILRDPRPHLQSRFSLLTDGSHRRQTRKAPSKPKIRFRSYLDLSAPSNRFRVLRERRDRAHLSHPPRDGGLRRVGCMDRRALPTLLSARRVCSKRRIMSSSVTLRRLHTLDAQRADTRTEIHRRCLFLWYSRAIVRPPAHTTSTNG